jgi:hypothetical protein
MGAALITPETRQLGPHTVVIDRPKGFAKTFRTLRGPEVSIYPVDYGYVVGVINPDDGSEMDLFLGAGHGTRYGRMMKGTTLEGDWRPDEHKWFARLTDAEFDEMMEFWNGQDPDLCRDVVEFADEVEFLREVARVQRLTAA